MTDYTVILKCPDYVEAEDNGYSGTWMGHVVAETPEDAIDAAIQIAAEDTGREISADPADGPQAGDWGFVSIFAGHLNNLYTP